MLKEIKISGKSCNLRTSTFIYIDKKELGEILNKQLGENYEGIVDIEITIKEVDTGLKIESNVEVVE